MAERIFTDTSESKVYNNSELSDEKALEIVTKFVAERKRYYMMSKFHIIDYITPEYRSGLDVDHEIICLANGDYVFQRKTSETKRKLPRAGDMKGRMK